jgi:copper transport protein
VLLIAFGRRDAWSLEAAPMAAVLLASFSVTGHAFATAAPLPRALAEVNDFVHLIAVACWTGGVVAMALVLPGLRRIATNPQPGVPVRQIFAATGTIAGILHVPGPRELVSSTYGRVLGVKIALVVVLLCIGYRQFGIGRGSREPGSLGALKGEAIVAAAVLVCSAVLVGQAPP